jgi:hypothetical protein
MTPHDRIEKRFELGTHYTMKLIIPIYHIQMKIGSYKQKTPLLGGA